MRDLAPFDVMLALIDESPKAWCVSPSGEVRNALWLPKSLCDRGDEPCGGFVRMGKRCQRAIYTIWEFSMPRFIAVSKGLAV